MVDNKFFGANCYLVIMNESVMSLQL